jgi:hypothetical protein
VRPGSRRMTTYCFWVAHGEFTCAIVGLGDRPHDVGMALLDPLIDRGGIGGHDVATGGAGFAAPLGAGFVAAEHDPVAP